MFNRYYFGMNGNNDKIDRNALRRTPSPKNRDDEKEDSPLKPVVPKKPDVPKKAIKKPTVGTSWTPGSSEMLTPDYVPGQNIEDNSTKAASASASNLPAETDVEVGLLSPASSIITSKPPKPTKPSKPSKPSEAAKIAEASNKAGEVAVLTSEPVIRPVQTFIRPVIRLLPNDRGIFIKNLRNTFKMTCGAFTPIILEEQKLEASFLPIDFVTAGVETAKLFSSNNTNYGAEILVTQLKKSVDVKSEPEQECKNLKLFERSSLNKFINWSAEEQKIKYESSKASSSEASSSEASSSDQPKETKQASGGPGEARLASRLGSIVNGDSFSYDMVMGISSENGQAPKCHKVEVKQLDTDGSFNTGIKVKKYAELNFFNRIKPLITNLDNLYKDAKGKKFNLLQGMDNILIRVLSLIEKCFTEGLTEAPEGFFISMNFVLVFLHNIKEQLKNVPFTIDEIPIDLLTCYQMYLPMKNRVQHTPNFDEIIGYKGSEQIALLLYYLDHEFIDGPARLQEALNLLLTPFVEENIKLALVNDNGFIILDDILDKDNAFVVFLRITKGAIRFKLMGQAYIKMKLSLDEIPPFDISASEPNQENLLASIFGRIGMLDNIDEMIEENKFTIEQLEFIKEVQTVQEFIKSYNTYIKKPAASKASASAAFTTPPPKSKAKGKKSVVSEASASQSKGSSGVKILNRYKLYF